MNIPTINIELMLAGWSQTHSGGTKITFWIDDADLEPFRTMTVRKGNTAGQRFMAALVELGDDDQPKDRDVPAIHSLVRSAAMVCATDQFQRFVEAQQPPISGLSREENAAAYLRDFCGIGSRRELADDEGAQKLLGRLMHIYREWQGENQ